MIHIVAGLLVLSLVSAQDLSCADSRLVDSDYIQMYCDADVVFRGSPVTAMSSVGLDTEGRQVSLCSPGIGSFSLRSCGF